MVDNDEIISTRGQLAHRTSAVPGNEHVNFVAWQSGLIKQVNRLPSTGNENTKDEILLRFFCHDLPYLRCRSTQTIGASAWAKSVQSSLHLRKLSGKIVSNVGY